MQSKAISPFSLLNNYDTVEKPRPLRDSEYLTPRDIIVANTLKSCGAAASFQLEFLWSMNGRRELKKMASRGLIMRSKLEGEYKLNVYSLNRQGTKSLLRNMAFCQLYLRMREVTPCAAAVLPWPLTGALKFNDKLYGVLVVRAGDKVNPIQFRGIDRMILISETITPDVLNLPLDYRLTTDETLLNGPLENAFYRPDGSRESIVLATDRCVQA